jgi:hypothetical protein
MIQRSFDATDPSYPSHYLGGQSIGSVSVLSAVRLSGLMIESQAWAMHNVSAPLHPHIRLAPPYDLHQDTILCSSDGVFFHVHRQQLATSVNSFASFLIDPTVHTIILQESSPILNCFLSLVYVSATPLSLRFPRVLIVGPRVSRVAPITPLSMLFLMRSTRPSNMASRFPCSFHPSRNYFKIFFMQPTRILFAYIPSQPVIHTKPSQWLPPPKHSP